MDSDSDSEHKEFDDVVTVLALELTRMQRNRIPSFPGQPSDYAVRRSICESPSEPIPPSAPAAELVWPEAPKAGLACERETNEQPKAASSPAQKAGSRTRQSNKIAAKGNGGKAYERRCEMALMRAAIRLHSEGGANATEPSAPTRGEFEADRLRARRPEPLRQKRLGKCHHGHDKGRVSPPPTAGFVRERNAASCSCSPEQNAHYSQQTRRSSSTR
ncbi:hypothetical protein HPB50_023435 [Hyalomma asiaticum]|uniref:Uncharacterized protein n=1 Tax=Hyalomma asiaticum TaxID=266040 RepID=A0ACB7TTS0_HYAAI|nr:hypothetical protein HPB50_023435 [Hyalomma asiaticum]